MSSDFSKGIMNPAFSEKRSGLIYIYSAIFVFDGEHLSPERIRNDFDRMYRCARVNRIERWMRWWLSYYILVPVYCVEFFDESIMEYISRSRQLGRLSILLKPVLYNYKKNTIRGREALQNYNFGYMRDLEMVHDDGIRKVARHFGHDPAMTRLVFGN